MDILILPPLILPYHIFYRAPKKQNTFLHLNKMSSLSIHASCISTRCLVSQFMNLSISTPLWVFVCLSNGDTQGMKHNSMNTQLLFFGENSKVVIIDILSNMWWKFNLMSDQRKSSFFLTYKSRK